MDVETAIKVRRAYRSLDPVKIDENIVNDLASCARLAPSCFNNQPWRFVFVYEKETLDKLKDEALTRGNAWAKDASMIIAVFSKQELDCVIRDRIYFRFDIGLATAFLILRATELGLVAHPIAGYKEQKVKEILGIPEDMTVITLVIVGKHSSEIKDVLSEKQKEAETKRPERLLLSEFAYHNKFK